MRTPDKYGGEFGFKAPPPSRGSGDALNSVDSDPNAAKDIINSPINNEFFNSLNAGSKNERFLAYLLTPEGISVVSAKQLYGETRLKARVHDHEKKGFVIDRSYQRTGTKGAPKAIYSVSSVNIPLIQQRINHLRLRRGVPAIDWGCPSDY